MQKCPPNEGSSLLTPHFTSRLFVFQEFISIYTCPLLFLLATNPFNRPSIPKHLSDRDLRCGRKPDVHRVGNLKLINLDQRLPFSVTGNHMESLVLLVIVVYSDDFIQFRGVGSGMNVDLVLSIEVFSSWEVMISMRYNHVWECVMAFLSYEFLWCFSIPAWFWANTRGSIQMRRTRTTTTSRYRLATDVSPEFFSATVSSWAKCPGALSQEYDPLELEELWEGCFLVVALEGWIK